MRCFRKIRVTKEVVAALGIASAFSLGSATASAIEVVTTIKPLHSLTWAVMEGVGEPRLLITGSQSPHTFALRPSDAKSLQNADVLFMIDPALETSLTGAIGSLARDARVVQLSIVDGVARLPYRGHGFFGTETHVDEHGHDERHEEDDHAEHEENGHREEHEEDDHHAEHEENGHHEEHEDEHQHAHAAEDDSHRMEDESDHQHGEFDTHIWLDPISAVAMVRTIADTLSEMDPANRERYQANARIITSQLYILTGRISDNLASVRNTPFLVFHDGYQYFEKRFGLTALGAVVVNPERAPGIKRLRKLKQTIEDYRVTCVFAEPQFNQDIVDLIVEGTTSRSILIDPLGHNLENDGNLYFKLLFNVSESFRYCLTSGTG